MPSLRTSKKSSGPMCAILPHVQMSEEQLREAITKKAREIFEKSGRKPGRDMENWLEAERIVKAHFQQTTQCK